MHCRAVCLLLVLGSALQCRCKIETCDASCKACRLPHTHTSSVPHRSSGYPQGHGTRQIKAGAGRVTVGRAFNRGVWPHGLHLVRALGFPGVNHTRSLTGKIPTLALQHTEHAVHPSPVVFQLTTTGTQEQADSFTAGCWMRWTGSH